MIPKLTAYVVAFGALLAALWAVYDYGGDVREAQIKAQYLEYMQAASDRVAEIDADSIKKLESLKNENETLRAAVDRGRVRLRVAANCPSVAESASVGNGTSPELAAEVRPDYFALRDGLGRQREQLIACQEILAEERKKFPGM